MNANRLLLSAAIALSTLVLLSCGESELTVQSTPSRSDPQDIRDQLVEAMRGSSYAFTLSTTFPGAGDREWLVKFDDLDRYSLTTTRVSYGDADSCDGILTNSGQEVCVPGEQMGLASESIWLEGTLYTRSCQDAMDCEDWSVLTGLTYPPPIVPIATAPYPQSPLYALNAAAGMSLVDSDETGLVSHIAGQFNPIASLLQLQGDVAASESSGGAECGGLLWPSPRPGESGIDCEPSDYQDEIDYYDEHPAGIDVWYSNEDHRISRLSMTVPLSPIIPPVPPVIPPGVSIWPEITVVYMYDFTTELDISAPPVQ